MDTLYRHWLILRMIPRRGRIATIDIQSRLQSENCIETTLRTVQRDLNELSLTFPLECDDNRPAGWNWRKDAPAFDIPNMDPVTALTFKLAEKHIARMMPHGVLNGLKPYIKVADERLKMTSDSALSRWPGKVRVVSRNIAMIPPVVPDNISSDVYMALLEERRFMVDYRTISGRKKCYEVNPLGMAFVDGLTYLVATLNTHEDPVLLLLHRMLMVELLDKAAKMPEGFDLDEYLADELAFPVGGDIRLKVVFDNRADVQRLKESPLAADQALRERDDGRYELTATVADSIQLRWWLRGYGARIEVISPKSLRQEFIELVQDLTSSYIVASTSGSSS
jgi:hypothetical protein